ncbi:MAG: glycine--tRNA ligase [Planctomycetes bacterium]|nr:glycine--tRNA ligase [Planctomycetota bacterium]
MERIVALAKRRGFIYPSSEIYGGINGFWDYGPLGVELKRNLKDAWWQDIVRCPPAGPDGRPLQMVGLDCSIIMNPKVWEASGHVVNFNDPLVDCKQCKARFRADTFEKIILIPVPEIPMRIDAWMEYRLANLQPRIQAGGNLNCLCEFGAPQETWQRAARNLLASKRAKLVTVPTTDQPGGRERGETFVIDGERFYFLANPIGAAEPGDKCPLCGGELTEPRKFNMMFKSHAGAMEDSASLVYLRPETAQGIFANYKNVLDTTRIKVPFGIAQIGKAFRNEINPRNFTFRSREFEQMEIEFFCHPSQADPWYAWWRDARYKWYVDHGLKSSKLRLRDHAKEELAHYARACADVEYEFPFGTSELEGIANRTDFDLKAHQEKSGRDMTFFDDETKERFIPHVIEPSGGIDRAALAFLCEAYCEDEAPDENGAMQKRTVLRFHPRLAPVKVAIFPLVKKDGMPEKALEIYTALRPHMTAFYDEKGAVGRRYRRQDEAGTPFCITVDGQTREDGTVTLRDRDSMKQERIASDAPTLLGCLQDRLRR